MNATVRLATSEIGALQRGNSPRWPYDQCRRRVPAMVAAADQPRIEVVVRISAVVNVPSPA
jgi:hypothetical protein